MNTAARIIELRIEEQELRTELLYPQLNKTAVEKEGASYKRTHRTNLDSAKKKTGKGVDGERAPRVFHDRETLRDHA